MNMHNELSLAFDPFWPLLPWTLQQDKQSCPEQYLANTFALGSQEELFVQRPTAGLIVSDCHGQGKQRERPTKDPLSTDPGLGCTRALYVMLKPHHASNSCDLLIVREGCAKPVQSNSFRYCCNKSFLHDTINFSCVSRQT